jgi:FtsZ-interacting cell division protein YlmF
VVETPDRADDHMPVAEDCAGGHMPAAIDVVPLNAVSLSDPAEHEVSSFDDVVGPADDYRQGRTIVVHVVADTGAGRRIIDFLSGLAYGTDGTLEKAAEAVYLLTPPTAE